MDKQNRRKAWYCNPIFTETSPCTST